MRSALVLWSGFAALALGFCPSLAPNFDEGVYLAQAEFIWNGQVPFRDFFYHQTPLYPLLIAPSAAFGTASVFVARGVSILATATAGLLLGRLACAYSGPRAGLFAQSIFYLAPLSHYGLLVLPNGIMVLCTVTGFYLLLVRERPVLAGCALAVAVFLKPLAVSTAIALVLSAAFARRSVPRVILGGALGGTLLIGLTALWSGGAFFDLLALQFGRYGERSGFEVMEQIQIGRAHV